MTPRFVLLAALAVAGCGKSDPTAADPAPPPGKADPLPPEVEFDPATAAKMKPARKPATP
jgi:hypothetical protein